MNTKNTKKRFVLSLVVTIVSIAMLVGATFAWFTDSVTSGKNVITAGNLDIELTHSNGKVTDEDVEGQTDLFALDYWEPGAVVYENFTVKNVGNLALKYKLQLGLYDYNTITIDDEQHSLADVLKVYMQQGTFSGTREDAIALVEGENIGENSINGYAREAKLGPKGSASANDVYSVIIYWKPTDNDNLYNVNNGKIVDTLHNGLNELFVEFGVHLVATQDTVEADYFDEFYDKDSTYDMMPNFKKATGSNKTSRESDKNNGQTENDLEIEINAKDLTGSTVKLGDAQVPKKAIDGVLDAFLDPMPTPEEATVIKDDVVLTLNVETKSSNSKATVLDITMSGEAVRTKTVGEGEPEVIASKKDAITELAAPVLVPLTLPAGLKNLKATHTHTSPTGEETVTEMIKVDDKDSLENGKFWYNEETGEFLAKMDKFSKVSISYDPIVDVARIGGVGYSSLYNAFAGSKSGDTVTMLQASNSPAKSVANIAIDLNGFAVSGVVVADNSTLEAKGKGSLGVTLNSGMLNVYSGEFSKLDINGKGDVILDNGKFEEITFAEDENINIKINGGIYHLKTQTEKATLEKYLSDTQYFKQTSEEGWYEVKSYDDNIVARIGDVGYTSFNSAIATVSGGQTVKMVKDVNYFSSADSAYFAPTYSGTRTFNLNGKTVSIDFGTFAPSMNAVLDIRESWSGTFGCNIVFEDSKGNGKLVAVQNEPETIVAAIGNNTHNFMNFEINGGTYQGATHGAFFQAGNVTINGGTFRGPIAFEYGVDDYSGTKYGDFIINGGTFDGNFIVGRIAEKSGDIGAKLNSVVVNGGKFKTTEAGSYLANDKILVEEDGWFVVKDKTNAPSNFTARMNNIYYTSVEGPNIAMNYAKQLNNATVELKAKSTVELELGINESITILGDTSLYIAPVAEPGITTLKTEEVIGGIRYYVPDVKPFTVYRGTTKVGDYDTLEDAKDTANKSSFTIKLNKDYTQTTNCTYSYQSSSTQNLTLDLQGHTLTLADGIKLIFSNKKDIVTIQNGTIVGKVDGGSDMIEFYNTDKTEGVQLINMNIENKGTGWVVYDTQNVSICPTKLIKNCTIKGAKVSINNYTVIGNSTITTSNTDLRTAIKQDPDYNYEFTSNGYSVIVIPKN